MSVIFPRCLLGAGAQVSPVPGNLHIFLAGGTDVTLSPGAGKICTFFFFDSE